MTTDSAKGPPSVELAQALQLPNLASVDKEQARSASIKPRPRQGQVTVELPREEPPNEKARTEAAKGRRKRGQSRRDRQPISRQRRWNGARWPEHSPYEG